MKLNYFLQKTWTIPTYAASKIPVFTTTRFLYKLTNHSIFDFRESNHIQEMYFIFRVLKKYLCFYQYLISIYIDIKLSNKCITNCAKHQPTLETQGHFQDLSFSFVPDRFSQTKHVFAAARNCWFF